ncbi:hypothetical protein AAZX31_12G199300 [Glycine max]
MLKGLKHHIQFPTFHAIGSSSSTCIYPIKTIQPLRTYIKIFLLCSRMVCTSPGEEGKLEKETKICMCSYFSVKEN